MYRLGGALGATAPGRGGILSPDMGLRIGLVYDLLGSWPRRAGDPADAEAEFEPEATVELLERAF